MTESAPTYTAGDTGISILFVRDDSEYKMMPGVDCYDAERNALTYSGNDPVVAHPPCRAWGVLKHMAKPALGEKELALWAVQKVRDNGGVLEHPSGSFLWREAMLPEPGWLPDEWGGFSIFIDQFDFGHVAHKKTKLYIVGCKISELPPLPSTRLEHTDRSIAGNIPGTKRCTQYQREYTPRLLRLWLIETVRIIEAIKAGANSTICR